MDTNSSTQWVVVAIVAVVLIGGGVWLFMRDSGSDVNGAATTTPNSNSTTTVSTSSSGAISGTVTQPSGEAITVADQPAGDSVRVSSVNLSGTGWVAVRDSMRIYGAARLNEGTSENVSIKLLRNIEAGKTYQVVVYVDDGDKVFDFKKDALVSGVSDSFTATNGD